jgi:nitric oxide reductase NorQ protein
LAIAFSYPEASVEAEIIAAESGVGPETARTLVRIAERARNLKGNGLEEGASTRMLINAGMLIKRGIAIDAACEVALILPITDDLDMRDALKSAVAACI